MTKGIAICNLNVHKGEPSTQAPVVSQLVSGDEIQIHDVVAGKTASDQIQGSSAWYKLPDNQYVWSGGVSVNLKNDILQKKLVLDNDPLSSTVISEVKILERIISQRDLLQFGNGEGISIAVLDTGINVQHPSLRHAIVHPALSYINNNGIKKNNHGTLVAGIICGKDDVITGISRWAKLVDIRVADKNGSVSDNAVYNALKDISDERIKCSLVNLSLDVSNSLVPHLQPLVDELNQKGIVVMVAGTTRVGQTAISRLKDVITVGAYSKKTMENIVAGNVPLFSTVSFLNKPMKSTSYNFEHINFKNSSAYTAVITGLVSNFLSSLDVVDQNAHQLTKEFLRSISFPITDEVIPQPFKLYRK